MRRMFQTWGFPGEFQDIIANPLIKKIEYVDELRFGLDIVVFDYLVRPSEIIVFDSLPICCGNGKGWVRLRVNTTDYFRDNDGIPTHMGMDKFDGWFDVYALSGQSFTWVLKPGKGITDITISIPYMLYDGADGAMAQALIDRGITLTPEHIDEYRRRMNERFSLNADNGRSNGHDNAVNDFQDVAAGTFFGAGSDSVSADILGVLGANEEEEKKKEEEEEVEEEEDEPPFRILDIRK